VTRDGRRLLLFFNIEPIPRVKWPAAAGLAERGRRRRGGRRARCLRRSFATCSRRERAAQGGERFRRVVGAGCSCTSSEGSELVCVTKRWADSERWRCWIFEGQVCALLEDEHGQYQALSHKLEARTTRSLGGRKLGRVQDRANNSPSALNARRKEYYT
jgi:hypothetical protein